MKKRINPIFNDRWVPVIISILLYLLVSIYDFYGFLIAIIVGTFFSKLKQIWNRIIASTIYGKVVYENRTVLPETKRDITLTCGKLHEKNRLVNLYLI